MLTRRDFVSTGLKIGAGLAATSAVAFAGDPTDTSFLKSMATSGTIKGRGSLKSHAAERGLFVGAAVSPKLLRSDPGYERTLSEQFNMVVAGNAMKWAGLRPAPEKYFFDDADEIVAYAQRHKMQVRGHTFIWHQAVPDWFAGTVTKDNARQVLTDHIMTVGQRYSGKIHSWDVVNEAILPKDGRPDGLRKSVWLELLGPDYLEIAFRAARQADPHALLTYNEYGVEYDSEEEEQRRGLILQQIRKLKAANVPLDAVGIQAHIKAGPEYRVGKGITQFIASVREMGLPVYLTELDVNEDDLLYDDPAKRDRAIAAVYYDFLNTTLADPAVKAVLTWGVSDKYTWLNDGPTHKRKQPNRPQRALLFDNDYRPKEAFFAVRDSIDRRPIVKKG